MRKSPIRYALLLCGLVYSTAAICASELVQQCVACHGEDGVSIVPSAPVIAGYSKQYIIDSMINYKLDERPSATMGLFAKNLKDDEIETIAEFFAMKTFVPRKQEFDAEKAKLGEKIHARHCYKCHEDGGSSPDDDAGILAGQWAPYLQLTFEQYQSGKRPMPENMKRKMEKLSQADIKALLDYYASLQ
ncbi:MAG: c-type cytochrome [Gammaproteobacteria bacterium]|nr:c-type cytochrome [Gammaproteobacteria bacterium]